MNACIECSDVEPNLKALPSGITLCWAQSACRSLAPFHSSDRQIVRNGGAASVVRWRWLLARSGLAVGGRAGDLHRPTHSLPLHCHTTAPAVVLDRGRFRAIRENRYCVPNMRQTFCCVPSCATYIHDSNSYSIMRVELPSRVTASHLANSSTRNGVWEMNQIALRSLSPCSEPWRR